MSQAGLPKAERPGRVSKLDPYLPFIIQTLEQYPTLNARRIYDMLCERGYRPDHVRHVIVHYRPRRPAEAYLRLRTLPGRDKSTGATLAQSVWVGRSGP